jgi:16S rRNA (adenine1518-N6/adenine1519-N6)-dimethyltransferase
VEAIAPRPADRFLEIGPGPGVLTTRLAARAASVTAIEIDRDLAADLRALLPPNVDVVTGDVLAVDLEPYVAGAPMRIAGNLPYNISSPILFKLLKLAGSSGFAGSTGPGLQDPRRAGSTGPGLQDPRRAGSTGPGLQDVRRRADLSGPPAIVDATLMLQREVADRLVAAPGTKEYGVLAILVAAHADVRRLLTLPPGAFRPAPKVHSAVVRLTFVPARVPAALAGTFERLVRMMFMQRRKTSGNALRPFAELVGRDAASALSAAGIDPTARPETLDLTALVRLASTFEPKA